MLKSLFGSLLAVVALTALPLTAAPVISLGTPGVVFNYTSGGAVPAAQSVAVTANEAATINSVTTAYVAGGSPGWLSVFPPVAFTTPNSLSFSVTPNNLPAGSYIANVTLNPAAFDPSSTLTVTVFLVVGGGGGVVLDQKVTATPDALAFTWSAGAALPAAKTIEVKVSDDAPFTVTRTTDSGAAWLSVSPASSASPGTVTVTVDPTGLSSGTYNGIINISAPFNVTQVPVTLTISGFGLAPDPASVTLNVPQNYGISGPQFVKVTSNVPLAFQTATDSAGNWLQVDLPGGNTPATLQIRANTSGLAQGTYSGTVTVRSGSLTSTDIPVTLVVGPPATLGLQPAGLFFSYTIGDAAPPTQTTRINSLSDTAQTFTSSVVTADAGSWLTATPDRTSTPAVLTSRVIPTGLAAGVYNAVVNIQPSATNAAPQPVQVTLTVKAPPPPVILSVNSSASYSALAITPGQFVTLFGSGLGPKDLVIPPNGTTPRILATTAVSFDGVAAPILYSSATQVGVQVPYSVNPGQAATVFVTYDGLTSPPLKINVLPAYPSLFTANASGTGPLAAVNINPTGYNAASNPVARGAIISLYGTGEGRTNPPVVEGTITPAVEPFPRTTLPVSVTIGGQLAEVIYAGEAPGSLAGLFQLNVRVPDTAPTGDAVPVIVFVNSIPSQSPATIAIK